MRVPPALKPVLGNQAVLFLISTILGVCVGLSGIESLQTLGVVISDIFIKIFRCISTPIIALSIIVTLAHLNTADKQLIKVWRKTIVYTFGTTVVAATISCLLYLLIKPSNVQVVSTVASNVQAKMTYTQYLATLFPSNFITPFIDQQVIAVLLIAIVFGIAIRYIPDEEAKQTVKHFFKGLYSLFIVITKWVVAILPIGLFGFITTTLMQFNKGVNISGLGEYLAVIVIANLVQGFIILPIWLRLNNIPAYQSMQRMLPALSVAFFSKSSAGTLPITIETAEKRLNIHPKISRFILPMCTTINMNGCAAFIFATVIYLMQNHGVDINLGMMGCWILIATIAAVGNAGVPMGCFFLSASLLSSMNVPIALLGIILPFYTIIDMIETALNVWSDSCVTNVVNHAYNAPLSSRRKPTSVR